MTRSNPVVRRRRLARFASIVGVSSMCSLLPLTTHTATGSWQPSGDATATVETDPVQGSGDAADDPAIWHNAKNPGLSAVIGNDKRGALEVYDMSGSRLQRIADGFYGNVDIRKGFMTGAGTVDIVVTWHSGIRVFAIDPSTRRLRNITDTSSGNIAVPTGGEGLCLYRSAETGKTYAIVIARNGHIGQYELLDADGDGEVEGKVRRDWDVGGEAEGCVADDQLGSLYVSEEAVGIWKYDAEPTGEYRTGARTLVDSVRSKGGRIRADAEGLTIVYGAGGGGYLIASSQAASDTLNSYMVYRREGSNQFVREFQVVGGGAADGCGRTDGIDAAAVDLGPGFRNGMFVCQDNANTAPEPGRQNFKFVPLERVVDL